MSRFSSHLLANELVNSLVTTRAASAVGLISARFVNIVYNNLSESVVLW